MSNNAVELKDHGLKELMKLIENNTAVAKVGILGSEERPSNGEGLTNAEIGLGHEFGSAKLPMRSFLRVPLIDNFQKYLKNAIPEGGNDEIIKDILREKSFMKFTEKLGVLGERIIQDAFDSGGFGTWKPSNMSGKKNKQTLVETQQLRDSIASEVVEGD